VLRSLGGGLWLDGAPYGTYVEERGCLASPMRSRDVTIPLVLWICAAICAHFLFGTGGLVVGKIHDDRSELWQLSREASNLADQSDQTFEVSLGEPSEESTPAPPPPPPPPHAGLPPQGGPPPPPPPKADDPPKAVPTAQKPPEPPKTKPEPQAKKAPEPKKVVVLKKDDEEKKPVVLPEDPLKDRRIAVRQHVTPNQQDNPNAHFIADEANKVDKETVATQTSHDRDDANPTPAGNHPNSEKQPGDSEKTRIADSEEHKGEKNRAPGERGTDFDVVHEPKIPKPEPQPTTATQQPTPQPQRTAGLDRNPAATAQAPGAQTPQPPPGGETPASPDVQTAPGGGWTFNPARPGGAPGTVPAPSAGAASPPLPGGKMWSLPGLGAQTAPGQMNTNIRPNQIATIVGQDNLRKMREADGERRLSQHRGSFAASSFERWRSAIENYVSSVKPGNQTALNTAAVPFATYLNGMHNRIHPIFADSFLSSLDALPQNHPMNDKHLVTRLEIVLTKEGHLKKMGVVKTSGITAFDIAALDSVDRAQPFGPAPNAIVSGDGNVYLHWEFHRDEMYACSTMGARPLILNNGAPKNEDPTQPPAQPNPTSPTRERGAPPASPNDAREGLLRAPARSTVPVTPGPEQPAVAQRGT
jgi:TonB family protein